MALNKEQILQIDNYLKKAGIKHWDIRLEMIDHIATQTEEGELIDLDSEMLKRDNNKYEIKAIAKQKTRLVYKKYKLLVYNEILYFFKSIKHLLILLIFYFIYFKILKETSSITYYRLSMILIFAPIFISIGYMSFNFIKKNTSIHLEYAMFYLMFPFSILNIFVQLLNPNGDFFSLPIQSFEIFLLLTIPIYLVLTYISFKIYLKSHKYYSKTFKDYLSVCH